MVIFIISTAAAKTADLKNIRGREVIELNIGRSCPIDYDCNTTVGHSILISSHHVYTHIRSHNLLLSFLLRSFFILVHSTLLLHQGAVGLYTFLFGQRRRWQEQKLAREFTHRTADDGNRGPPRAWINKVLISSCHSLHPPSCSNCADCWCLTLSIILYYTACSSLSAFGWTGGRTDECLRVGLDCIRLYLGWPAGRQASRDALPPVRRMTSDVKQRDSFKNKKYERKSKEKWPMQDFDSKLIPMTIEAELENKNKDKVDNSSNNNDSSLFFLSSSWILIGYSCRIYYLNRKWIAALSCTAH